MEASQAYVTGLMGQAAAEVAALAARPDLATLASRADVGTQVRCGTQRQGWGLGVWDAITVPCITCSRLVGVRVWLLLATTLDCR